MDGNLPQDALVLLREIKSAVSEGPYAKYVVAGIAVLGVVIGQLSQLLIVRLNAKHESEKQKNALRAEIITKKRQEWMDSVRETATEFLVTCDTIYNSKIYPGLLNDQQKIESALKALYCLHYIELKLNRNKTTQGAVISSMCALHSALNKEYTGIQDFSEAYKTSSSKFKEDLVALFNETWRRIKSLD